MSEFVVPAAAPKPGWTCPSCFGMGTRMDGKTTVSETEIRFTAPTKCSVCRATNGASADGGQMTDEQRRIRARWTRGLHFRLDWHHLEFLLKYSDSVDPEGIA